MNAEHYRKYRKTSGLRLQGLIYDANSQDVILFKNVPVISKVNNKELGLVNNETFKIDKIIDDKITMKNEYKELTINKDDFQYLFYLAYCITVCRSQGSTFNTSYTIHEWWRMDKRLKYVALSRSSNIKHINIVP